MLKDLLEKIINYLNYLAGNTIDTTNLNGEVYLHKPTAELVLINYKGELEGPKHSIPENHLIITDLSPERVIFSLDRRYFEYLGKL